MVRSIHVVVWVGLTVWTLTGSILVHLHVGVRSILRRLRLLRRHDLLLLLLLTLSAHALKLLLFLHARCRRSA